MPLYADTHPRADASLFSPLFSSAVMRLTFLIIRLLVEVRTRVKSGQMR